MGRRRLRCCGKLLGGLGRFEPWRGFERGERWLEVSLLQLSVGRFWRREFRFRGGRLDFRRGQLVEGAGEEVVSFGFGGGDDFVVGGHGRFGYVGLDIRWGFSFLGRLGRGRCWRLGGHFISWLFGGWLRGFGGWLGCRFRRWRRRGWFGLRGRVPERDFGLGLAAAGSKHAECNDDGRGRGAEKDERPQCALHRSWLSSARSSKSSVTATSPL